ncbi:MAG: UDP-3-O-acylglucosamine N-acyltransferase [Chlamydiae bacterium]|nr:UDP-3-O-acylglucosamine N-acyltransferase [Chlamydiota bacterium]
MSHSEKKSFELQELAKLTNTKLEGDPRHRIVGVADLSHASSDEASFLGHPRYEKKVKDSRAGVIIIRPDAPRITAHNFLLTDDPYGTFQKVVELVYADQVETTGFEGIHPTAVIHPTAKVGEDVAIGPHVVIDKGARIGKGTEIRSGAMIGLEAVIGEDCMIHSHVVIKERCTLGDRVLIQPGTIIGVCGYGFKQDQQGRHQKLHHYGIVEIHDDVEIGPNAMIARARFHKTVIGEGTKIDGLVEIGHNVQIGKHCIIVGQSVVAGSTKLGDYIMIGSNVAIDGHLDIASGAMIRAFSGVTKSIKGPGAYGGFPTQGLAQNNRMDVLLRNIGKHVERIKELEKRVLELESGK